MQDISRVQKENSSGVGSKRTYKSSCLSCLSTIFKVRLAALKVLEGFHARLGEDFMVLLPETIPFLAELMEGKSRKKPTDQEAPCFHLQRY